MPELELDDWDHRDYIEDVLAEHFNIDYDYVVEDESTGKFTLHFFESTTITTLQNVIDVINRHHALSDELYGTI